MMKNVLGLDLGAHTLKAVELRQTLRGLEPVQLRVHPRADPEAPLAEVLQRFVRMHQLSTEHIACALPSDRLSSRRLEFPFRDRKRLAPAVPFAVEGQIPFDLDDVIIDWEVVGGERNHAEVAATLAPRREVSNLLAELGEAHCEPRILEAEGLVLGNLAALFDLPGTRLLVDIGHRKTTLCLLRDEAPVASRSLPIGGAALTQAIARDRGWSLDDAERAKCEDGVFHLGFNSASPGAVAILDQLAREIMRTLESLEDVLGGSPETQVSAITLMGGSARLLRIDEYIAERAGIPTARLALPPEGSGSALVAGGDPVLFAPAIALALRATNEARTRMNFRQDEFTYRTDLRQLFGRDMRPAAVMAGCAVLLLGLSAGTGITVESRRAGRLEAEVQRLYSDAVPGAAPSNPMGEMSRRVQEKRDLADFLGAYGRDQSALDLLTELSRRIPQDLDVTFQELDIDRRGIRIKVSAPSFEAADRLTSEIASREPFQSAKVAGEVSSDPRGGGKTFSLSIRLDEPERDS
jgi:general secretion pathway protein L